MHGLYVIRLIRVIGGDVNERIGSGDRIGTTGPRTEAGVRWEVLLNGPRMARIRGCRSAGFWRDEVSILGHVRYRVGTWVVRRASPTS